MAVKIDKTKCIGCGSCAALCPDGFEIENGKAKVKNQKAKCVKEAADSCPVQAISVK
ncbi:ferredoxin [Candidatus Pacearchaeota archaeon]|nr:ferredoxin [Candidatus Pacearchaeota archaeon]